VKETVERQGKGRGCQLELGFFRTNPDGRHRRIAREREENGRFLRVEPW